ncbi:MAG: hypothetical protein IJL50_09980 [Bacteroidaceae bacterium]|nr:hypothetical protein [Bacteroidaceae bacterium]
MKKYIIMSLAAALTFCFTSCKEDNGTEPGTDSQPAATIYTYEPSAPLNPDNDVNIRFVCNSKTSEAYYLVEKTTEKEAHKMSEAAYADFVVANGTKLQLTEDKHSGGKVSEVTVAGLLGDYTITAVAANGGTKTSATKTFRGLMWEDVVKGTYMYSNANVQFLMGEITSRPTTLQICTTDETLYRFKDAFGEGMHMKINLLPDLVGEDEGGVYTFFRVKDQMISEFQGNKVYVRDIGYWQGDDKYVTDYGFESGMYEDYSCFIYIQCHIGSTNYGYGYDYFIPDEEGGE